MKFTNNIAKVEQQQRQIQNHPALSRATLLQLREYYSIALTYSSNALEGSSLSEEETRIILKEGLAIGGKPLREQMEALGHSEAFNMLYYLARLNNIETKSIQALHQLCFYRTNAETAGSYRSEAVIISESSFMPPQPAGITAAMANFEQQIPQQKEAKHPLEFAAWLHTQLMAIHPFTDGNGKTARLLMNLGLLQAGYPVTMIPPQIRGDYMATLNSSNNGSATTTI